MKAINVRSKNGIRAPGVHYMEAELPKKSELQTGVPMFVGFGHAIGQSDCECFTVGRHNVFRLTGAEQFEQCIMIDVPHGFLDYAIRGFFENGGESCVVVPLEEVGENSNRIETLCKLFNDNGELEDVDNIDLVCAPDIMRHEILSSSKAVVKLQQHILAYCRRMGDRFAVLDSPPFQVSVEQDIKSTTEMNHCNTVEYFLKHIRKISHKGRPAEGAMYAPWVCVQSLARHNDDVSVCVPPCGHIAGIYARSDRMLGVHKAPANEIVEGALDLEYHISGELQAELNTFGVNCLRSFPGRGIRVWGARTLSSQMNWKYINVRRLFLTLVRWVMHNLDDMIFEPNEPTLWDNVTDRVGSYCYELYRRGALKGLSPEEAYFVKCDSETNPIELREAGQLICEVGLAPVVPAEFVVVRIVKNLSGTTATLPTSI